MNTFRLTPKPVLRQNVVSSPVALNNNHRDRAKDTRLVISEKETAVLLVDTLALAPLRSYLQSGLNLQNLLRGLDNPKYNSDIVRQEIFFSRHSTNYESKRAELHNWARVNRWRVTETQTPQGHNGRLTNAPDIGAVISSLLLQGSTKHIYILANELGLEPFFRLARSRGVKITLIYVDDENFHAYSSLVGNVDAVLDPADIPGVLDPTALPREEDEPLPGNIRAMASDSRGTFDTRVEVSRGHDLVA